MRTSIASLLAAPKVGDPPPLGLPPKGGSLSALAQPVAKAWLQSASPTAGITAYGNSDAPRKKKRKRVRLIPAT